jgi:crossover junction endodeoxyribonuclease RusA
LDTITIELPWPPSANTYWRRNGNTYFITPKGIAYRKLALIECRGYSCFDSTKRLRVEIDAYPPDKRRRDLDNLGKCILDSLQGLIYDDDSQIDFLSFRRMPNNMGLVVIHIGEI